MTTSSSRQARTTTPRVLALLVVLVMALVAISVGAAARTNADPASPSLAPAVQPSTLPVEAPPSIEPPAEPQPSAAPATAGTATPDPTRSEFTETGLLPSAAGLPDYDPSGTATATPRPDPTIPVPDPEAQRTEARTIFYNIGPGRSGSVVQRELRAIAREGYQIIGLAEAIRYNIPPIPGYRLMRDSSRPGRENLAAYVDRGLGDVKDIVWTDLRATWSRPKGSGRHPARSVLQFEVAGARIVVAHQPPRYTDNVVAAQQEGIDALTRIMDPYIGPTAVLWDANRRGSEAGPGPAMLAQRLGGQVVGDGIDGAVIRSMKATRIEYRRSISGVRLGTDHVRGAATTNLAWRSPVG